MRRLLTAPLEALFRVLFTYECAGQEHVPARGGAVIASNHPSYLDPVLLSLGSRRPLRFMAWDALFRVPLLGALIRAAGAFPVDLRRGKGRDAYERARSLVERGELVGIFPEGRRSQAGSLEPSLREGAARLAWETGAPLVPATIAGGFRAWPHFRALPRAVRVKVRFHEAIDPAPYRGLGEEEALPAILAELRRRVERSLLPGVKADRRMEALYRQPAPWPRIHEFLPVLALAAAAFWRSRALPLVAPAYGYLAYLLVDHYALPQRRFVKRVRNVSPVPALLLLAHHFAGALGLPDVPAPQALAAITAGAFFPYLYERGSTAIDFVRGMVAAIVLEIVASTLSPLGAGPHVALTVFAAAFAWERRTVFWGSSVLALLAYAACAARWLGGGPGLLLHALAGGAACLVPVFLPYHRGQPPDAGEEPTAIGLDLHR